MKFLLLLAIVMIGVWLVRGSRRRAEPPPAPPTASAPPRSGAAQDIVACAQCGVHLPVAEALPGRGGVFCGETHRAEFEKLHPPH